MIRGRAVTNIVNPPGQIKYIPGPDTIKHNVEEWKKLEQQKTGRSQGQTSLGDTQSEDGEHGMTDEEKIVQFLQERGIAKMEATVETLFDLLKGHRATIQAYQDGIQEQYAKAYASGYANGKETAIADRIRAMTVMELVEMLND